MDLTEAEDIKKRWQEYTEELYRNDLHNPDNQDGVITHLEPDILECEVKWVLGSITTNKASGGDGIPVELFKPRSPALQADSLPAEAPGKFMQHQVAGEATPVTLPLSSRERCQSRLLCIPPPPLLNQDAIILVLNEHNDCLPSSLLWISLPLGSPFT